MSTLGAAVIGSAAVLLFSASQGSARAASLHEPPAPALFEVYAFFHGGECTGQEYLSGSCP
jgi:hypothetical protein